MKNITIKLGVSAILFFMALSALAAPVLAATPDLGLNYAANLGLAGKDEDPRDATVDFIKYAMTFLGLIAVIVMLYGGFRWMTAGGNEDRVSKAKQTIIAGAIGLAVVMASYAIVQFVVNTTSNILG